MCNDELAYDLSPEQWLCYGISERRAGDLLCHVPVGMWQGPMPTAVERHLARLEVVHSFASTHMGHALRALCAPGVIPEAVLLQQGVSGLMETTQKAIALPMGNISRQLDYLRRALEDARRKAEGLPPDVSQECMSETAKAVRKMRRRRLFGLRPATIVGVKPVKDLRAVPLAQGQRWEGAKGLRLVAYAAPLTGPMPLDAEGRGIPVSPIPIRHEDPSRPSSSRAVEEPPEQGTPERESPVLGDVAEVTEDQSVVGHSSRVQPPGAEGAQAAPDVMDIMRIHGQEERLVTARRLMQGKGPRRCVLLRGVTR